MNECQNFSCGNEKRGRFPTIVLQFLVNQLVKKRHLNRLYKYKFFLLHSGDHYPLKCMQIISLILSSKNASNMYHGNRVFCISAVQFKSRFNRKLSQIPIWVVGNSLWMIFMLDPELTWGWKMFWPIAEQLWSFPTQVLDRLLADLNRIIVNIQPTPV